MLSKTYVYVILNRWVNGTVSGASGLCQTQKEKRRRRKPSRAAEEPHMLIK